ncbi:MAG: hypothetical protein NVSMB64_18900 [Candidatus Velthaea sp.]
MALRSTDTRSRSDGFSDLLSDGAFNVKEFARFSGLSLTKVYQKVRGGELVSIRIDGRLLIPKKSAIAFLADRVRV